MPYRICKSVEIESGHLLSKHPEHCRYPHGHSRRVEIVIESDTLDERDMICDFADIKSALKSFLERFDHAMCMNSDDPMFDSMRQAYGDRIVEFEHCDPTTEVVARYLFEQFREQFAKNATEPARRHFQAGDIRLVKIRIWETSSSWAEYSA